MSDKHKEKKITGSRAKCTSQVKIREISRKRARDYKCERNNKFLQEQSLLEGVTKLREDVCTIASNVDVVADIAKQIAAFKENIAYHGTDRNDVFGNLVSRLEDFVCLLTALNGASDWPSFIASAILFIKTYVPGSIAVGVAEFITKDFMVEQSDFCLSDILSSWKVVKGSAIARKFADLFDIILTVGLVPEACPNIFRLTEFKTFQSQAWDLKTNALSFVEMILSTAVFFIERGYHALKTGDWSILLYEEDKMLRFDKEYALLTSALPIIEAGRLADLATYEYDGTTLSSDAEFDQRLEALIKDVILMIRAEKGPARQVLNTKLSVLMKLSSSLIMLRKRSCIREKPFGVLIYGPSSVGKSSINNLMVKAILSANGLPSGKESCVVMNANDKFQSEYRPHHVAVTMDDFGNTRPEHCEAPQTNVIIDFVNNVPKAALNPEADKKGNIMIQPKLFTVTTNVKNLLAPVYSNEPVSILRRFELVIDVALKPEHTDPETGGPRRPRPNEPPLPSIWQLKLQRVKIVRNSHGDRWEFVPLHEGFLDIHQALAMAINMSKEHFGSQRRYVEAIEDVFDFHVCCHGFYAESESAVRQLCDECMREYDDERFENLDASAFKKAFDRAVDMAEGLVEHSGFDLEQATTNWKQINGIADSKEPDVPFVTMMKNKLCEARRSIPWAPLLLVVLSAALVSVRLGSQLTSQDSGKAPQLVGEEYTNVWKKVEVLKLPTSVESKTTTVADLIDLVSSKIGHCRIHKVSGKVAFCNVFPVKGNLWLIPNHALSDADVLEVRTTQLDVLGKNFKYKLHLDDVFRIPDTDYAVVRMVPGGDNRDLSKFFPEGEAEGLQRLVSTVVYRNRDGLVELDYARYSHKARVNLQGGYDAYWCNLTKPTREGLCMAVHVTDTRYPAILGFHLAGNTGKPHGVIGCITRQQLDAACDTVSQRVFVCHSSGSVDLNLVPSKAVRVLPSVKRHACQWLGGDEEPTLQVFGDHSRGRVTFHTSVRTLPISDSVRDILNLPRIHGPPDRRAIYRHWHRHLSEVSTPSFGFDPPTMRRANDDLYATYIRAIDQNDWHQHIHVLDHDTILAGRDGIRALDRIDLNTSMGWPWNEPKTKYITPSDRVVEGIACPLDLDPEVMSIINEWEDILLSGRRVYAVFRASLKDEAVKYTKDKIRVFSGCPFPLVYLMRKYFLTIVRFFQTHWLECETAVGINAYGRDWDALASNFRDFGDYFFDGDYASYDTRQGPCETAAVWDMYISLASYCGYSDDDITIMKGLATEAIYPFFEYDGTFVQVFGMMASGIPLTVTGNGTGNGNYNRYSYYREADHLKIEPPPFRDVVLPNFTGDDNIVAVKEKAKWFNREVMAKWMKEGGVVYTPADKQAEITPWSEFCDLSYLKRQFRFDSDTQSYLAPLEESSISKSLHNYKSSKRCMMTPEQRSGDALGAACREYFQHGREVYEDRKVKIQKIIDLHELGRFVVLPEYSEMLDMYNGTYDAVEIHDVSFSLTEQSGEEHPDDEGLTDFEFATRLFYPDREILACRNARSSSATSLRSSWRLDYEARYLYPHVRGSLVEATVDMAEDFPAWYTPSSWRGRPSFLTMSSDADIQQPISLIASAACIEFNDWSVEKFTGGHEYLYFYPMHVWSATSDILREIVPLEAAHHGSTDFREGMSKLLLVVYQEMHARREWGGTGILIPCRPIRKYLTYAWTLTQLAVMCTAIIERFPSDTNYHIVYAEAHGIDGIPYRPDRFIRPVAEDGDLPPLLWYTCLLLYMFFVVIQTASYWKSERSLFSLFSTAIFVGFVMLSAIDVNISRTVLLNAISARTVLSNKRVTVALTSELKKRLTVWMLIAMTRFPNCALTFLCISALSNIHHGWNFHPSFGLDY